jgi:hypothetical protein
LVVVGVCFERLAHPFELLVVLDGDEGVVLHSEDHRGIRVLGALERLEDRVAAAVDFEYVYDAELVLRALFIEQLDDILVVAHRGIPLATSLAMRPRAGVENTGERITSAGGCVKRISAFRQIDAHRLRNGAT